MDMQAFLSDEEGFHCMNGQSIHMEDQGIEIQGENIFGIEYKENMFEEPSSFSVELPEQEPVGQIFCQFDESCASEQTATTPTLSTAVEHPPCRCYRINCQKKYCQCFRNGRKCTKRCICIDCHNQPVVTRMKVNVEQFWNVSYMFRNISRKC